MSNKQNQALKERPLMRLAVNYLCSWFSFGCMVLLIAAIPCAVVFFSAHLSSRVLEQLTERLKDVVSKASVWLLHILMPTSLAFVSTNSTWCKHVGLGCGLESSFQTTSYSALSPTSFAMADLAYGDLSHGDDFQDCMHDLHGARSQMRTVAHLLTLSPKVFQWRDFLERPDELAQGIKSVAMARRHIVLGADDARNTGAAMMNILGVEVEKLEAMIQDKALAQDIAGQVSRLLHGASISLGNLSGYLNATSKGVSDAEDFSEALSASIHREMSRLRDINKSNRYIGSWVKRWWHPEIDYKMRELDEAATLLKEVMQLLDGGMVVLSRMMLTLQQCKAHVLSFEVGLGKRLSHWRSATNRHSRTRYDLRKKGQAALGREAE